MNRLSVFRRPYFWVEFIFIFCYFLLSGPLSALEYFFYEAGASTAAGLRQEILQMFLYSAADLVPYTLFYLIAVRNLLQRKKLIWFLLSVVVFMLVLNVWKLGTYWTFSRLWFLPGLATASAKYLHSPVRIHFSVVYVIRDLLALIALGFFLRTAEQDRTLADLKRLQAESELKQLRGQLQPHYFFNTLNSIYALSIKQSPLTPVLIARHAEMMRYVLYKAGKEKVPLMDEVRFLEALVAIEKVRQTADNLIVFETQGIDETIRIEPLILLPFVENAFKHGMRAEDRSGYVKIVICRIGQEIMLDVRNSLPGGDIPGNDAPGIGLDNIRKRLDLLYPGCHRLNVSREAAEFKIFLSLKLVA